jgi:hypothetical protein
MSDDQNNGKEAAGAAVDRNLGVDIGGEMYYPLPPSKSLEAPSELNPCAGKENGTSCGSGCVCRNGQCYYTLLRLQEMGVTVRDK